MKPGTYGHSAACSCFVCNMTCKPADLGVTTVSNRDELSPEANNQMCLNCVKAEPQECHPKRPHRLRQRGTITEKTTICSSSSSIELISSPCQPQGCCSSSGSQPETRQSPLQWPGPAPPSRSQHCRYLWQQPVVRTHSCISILASSCSLTGHGWHMCFYSYSLHPLKSAWA